MFTEVDESAMRDDSALLETSVTNLAAAGSARADKSSMRTTKPTVRAFSRAHPSTSAAAAKPTVVCDALVTAVLF